MNNIILYGSQYGSTRLYAEELSERTGIPTVCCRNAPDLSQREIIVYLGGIYAGGVVGLSKTLRHFSLRDGQKLILVTVGLADPKEPENRNNIGASLQRQLPAELLKQAKIFYLRGRIDYQRLSFAHRLVMALLYHSLRKTPIEKLTAENHALIETYGKQVDFMDFDALDPIVREIERK